MCQRKKKHQYGYFLSFIIPSILLVGMYAFQRVFPFGNHTIVTEDMANQYLAIMTYFKHNITHPSNFLYSYQISIGGNFFSVLTYYLMCPFNFLTFLFSEKYIPLFYAINTVFDVGLIGLTTYTYLKKSIFLNREVEETCFRDSWRLFLACIFPFSSFFANYMNCVMWLNAIVLMPLVILGLDRILYGNQNLTWLYWGGLMLLLISNYYIGVIILVFLFLLTVFWVIDQVCQFNWTKILKKGFTVLGLTVGSILGAGVVMWPSFLAQQNVAQAQMPTTNFFAPVYEFKMFWSSLFSGSIDPHYLKTAPLVFEGLLVIILFLSYFFISKIKIREKILTGLFTLVLIASSYFLYFYMIWHSLSIPNGYYQRESFVISFFMICIAYQGLQVFESKYFLRITIPIIIGIITMMFSLQETYKNLFSNNQLIQNTVILVLFLVGMILIIQSHKIGIPLIMLVSLVNIVMYNSGIQAKDFRQVSNNDYSKVVSENQTVFNALKQYDHSFYRVGTTAQINVCDPLLYGYNGVQTYLSQQPTSETDYLSALGFYQKQGWIRWSAFNNGSTGMINDMLGIKYIVKSDNSILKATEQIKSMPTYNNQANVPALKPVLENKHTVVYQNSNAFPLVFGAYDGHGHDSVFNGKYAYVSESNPFIAYGWMFKRLSGKQWLYGIQPGFELTIWPKAQVAQAQGYLNSTGDVYCYITKPQNVMPGNQRYLPIEVNGREVARYSNQNAFGENGIIYLGHFKKGDHLNIQIKNAEKDPTLPKDKIYVAVENQPMLHQIRKDAVTGIGKISVDGPQIKMNTTTAFKRHILIASVPYDKAWQATVDGHPVKVRKALDGLVAIKVTPGKHNIQFNYVVPGLKIGTIVSLIAILTMIILELFKFYGLKKFHQMPSHKKH
ncbi:YfhO family protein [Ligilactobacillus aviarius]|uniref:YfhO family protein n=1 Tax=Ligilactobacillus aviarius TaxID=1606 RepID=UPI00255B7CD0|nr:YfhO family protein [Ligilactobacillus aviarius]